MAKKPRRKAKGGKGKSPASSSPPGKEAAAKEPKKPQQETPPPPAPAAEAGKDSQAPPAGQSDPVPAEAGATKPTEESDGNGMSEEDRVLKENLELLVARVQDADEGVRAAALAALRKEIQSSTDTMTSIPKPLKFIRPHYQPLEDFFQASPERPSPSRLAFADLLSCLAMVSTPSKDRKVLQYALISELVDFGHWGSQYVSHLTAQLSQEFTRLSEEEGSTVHLHPVVDRVVAHFMEHRGEADACDLLMEVDRLQDVADSVDADTFRRVCRYLVMSSYYTADVEEQTAMLETVFAIYMRMEEHCEAMRMAIKLDSREKMVQVMQATEDPVLKKQLAFLLGSHKLFLAEFEDDDEIAHIMGNGNLHEQFLSLARDLNVADPKTPEDIYKSHFEESGRRRRQGGPRVDSARENLATTFMNAFVHAGCGTDTLMTTENSDWAYKNKDHGMFSATASLGLIKMWDLEEAFSVIDKYTFVKGSPFVSAGALLGIGIVSTGVTSDMDAASALLSEHLTEESTSTVAEKRAAVLGMGLAYAGTEREDVIEIISPMIDDPDTDFELACYASLALGFVCVGSKSDEAMGFMLSLLLSRSAADLKRPIGRLFMLGFSLLFLGCGEEAAEGVLDSIESLADSLETGIRKELELLVQVCSFAGTGSVLAIQRLMSVVGEHEVKDEKKHTDANEQDTEDVAAGAASIAVEDASDASAAAAAASAGPAAAAGSGGAAAAAATDGAAADASDEKDGTEKDEPIQGQPYQGIGVLGIATVALGEHLGSGMAFRMFDNILQYCELTARRAVPLAIGLLSVGNPDIAHMDTLSKLSHDQDNQVSQNAILSLGLIGAGTNNSRIAKLLRQLAVFYDREPDRLFMVRIAQGILHLGKGLLTLNPLLSDSLTTSKVGLAGLLTVLLCMLDAKSTILSDKHFLLYFLAPAIRPRMLVCVDEELQTLRTEVRVGQAVEPVRLAGTERNISGFQTHTAPVLLNRGDRAELATDEYLPLSPVLEGFVILRKNPDSEHVKSAAKDVTEAAAAAAEKASKADA